MTTKKSKDQLGIIKGAVQMVLCKMVEGYLEFKPTVVLCIGITSVHWIMYNVDSLKAGSLRNSFFFTKSKINEPQWINQNVNIEMVSFLLLMLLCPLSK